MGSTKNPEALRRQRQNQQQRALPQIQALYDELHQRFPHTFFREPIQVSPLKKGTYQELKAVLADSPYNARVISWALNRYTRRYGYIRAVAVGKPRIDLSGNPAGVVTEDEQHEARAQITAKRRRRGKSRKVYYTAEKQTEGASLVADKAVDTAMDEEHDEEQQPVQAQRKTTKNSEDNA